MTDEHAEHNNAAEQKILDDIKEYGCHMGLIGADNYLPGFAYTIGLYETYGHPEIICFGLSDEMLSYVLNHAHAQIKEGVRFEVNKPYSGFLEDYTVQLVEVDKAHYADYLGYAGWYYDGFDFPALQLVWQDMDRRFPWDNDFNPDWKFRQPLLDRNTDFKFYEERNLGVYTTGGVLNGEPILYVYHNEDGDWQFHSSNNPDMKDGKLVSLESIVRLDPTVNDIYHLQYGWKAWRNSKDDEWDYDEDTEE